MNDGASNIIAGEQTGTGAKSGKSLVFEDSALVARTRKGDMQAFALLVAKYQDRIFNLMMKMCPRRAEAEELCQEAFLKALENLGQFRGSSRFYTWLFRIAANLAISSRRRSARVRFQSLTACDDADGTQAEHLTAATAARRQVSPPAAAMSAEVRMRVTRAIEELDDEFSLVLVLRDIEDMDYSEISQVTDLPIGTVKSRLHRARCAMREKLADLMAD